MLIFPYRAQIELHKLPVLTIFISVACLIVFFAQDQNARSIERWSETFCEQRINDKGAVLEFASDINNLKNGIPKWARDKDACIMAMLTVYVSPDSEQALVESIDEIRTQIGATTADQFKSQYRSFAGGAPSFLTARLWHSRTSWNPLSMLSSTIAHGGWDHVIGNLFFFFAFAATVELLIGPALYLAVFFVMAIGIGMFDTCISSLVGEPMPTLGLSGVVMGMMALFVYFIPRARIRFFYWIFIVYGRFSIPAWLVASWYMGWDLTNQLTEVGGYVNYIAHLSGAALGFLIGVAVFHQKRHWAQELVYIESNVSQDPSAVGKAGTLASLPFVIVGFFIGTILLFTTLVWLFEKIWIVLLLMLPVAAGAWQIYRSSRGEVSVSDRITAALEALDRREYDVALKHLEPLAETGNARALYGLGILYSSATGALHNEELALEYLEKAAKRGNADAQYMLGGFYAEGRAVIKNTAKAIEWYEKAAQYGCADAGNSLGYIYENGVGVDTDPVKAIRWYYRAAVAYHRTGRTEDMKTMIRILEHLGAKAPTVLQLVARLKGAAV